MKKIVCELCEGTEFVKADNMFVCQGCGTKYSAEEARGMMREVEGDAPAVTGTPVAGAPVGNPYQQQIDNLLLLASNAFSASNNEETETYCNKAIEYDATCYKAWFLKAKAIGWSSTVKNPRIKEAAHSFKQAVDFAPEEEKESLTEEAVEELKRLGLACIALRQERFSKYPDSEELDGFMSDIQHLIDGLVVLLSREKEVAADVLSNLTESSPLSELAAIKFIGLKSKARAAGVPEEYFSTIAVMMGNAAIGGFNTTAQAYNDDSRPMPNDFHKALTEVDNCITLLDIAIDAGDDDDDDDIKLLESKIKMEEYTIGMTAYADFGSSYRNWMLTDGAKQTRRNIINSTQEKIREIQDKAKAKAEEERKKAEEEKQARIQAYWEAHADEKAALDAKKKALQEKTAALDAELSKLDEEIKAARQAKSGKLPSEEERDKIMVQIRELGQRRSSLGLFAGKEKKQIDEERAVLQGRADALWSKVEAEQKAQSAKIEEEIAPTRSKRDELDAERAEVAKRIAAIDAELTKDPEA